MKVSRNFIANSAVLAVVAVTGIALSPLPTVAAALIDGSDIANNSIASRDLKNNNVKSKDIKDNNLTGADIKDGTVKQGDLDPSLVLNGVPVPGDKGDKGDTGDTGAAGATGATGAAGPAGAPFTYVGAEWSLIDRNVIGNAYAELRPGPSSSNFGVTVKPPLGIGSLGIHTGSPSDKVAFGNQIDYAGDPLASITTVKYDVYTTGENRGLSVNNLAGVGFEIDPTGPATSGPGGNYSTLVYVPVEAPANMWSTQDATTADQWFLTGNNPGQAGVVSGCNQTPSASNPNGYCTLAEVKAVFPDATLHTVQITKGRDYAFTGAVDKLVISAQTFDFEPNGVRVN